MRMAVTFADASEPLLLVGSGQGSVDVPVCLHIGCCILLVVETLLTHPGVSDVTVTHDKMCCM